MRRLSQGTPRPSLTLSLTYLFKFIPAGNYIFKVKKGSRYETYSKSIIKTLEQRRWPTKVSTVNFDYNPPFALESQFLALNMLLSNWI